MTSDPLVKEIYIDAPPGVVFELLTDPVKMLRWMGIAAEIEPRPGGVYRVDPNGRDVIRGTYLEVVPDRKVVFTWGWEGIGRTIPAGSTVVEIELESRGKGTWVRLTHKELPPEMRQRHDIGWIHYLSRLKSVAEGTDPGPDKYATLEVRHG